MTADWNLTVNFSPENAAIVARQGQAAMGFYKVRCTDTTYYPATDDGKKPFIALILTITESAHDAGEVGNTIRERINLPNEAQTEKGRAWTERFLKGALVGLGHDATVINQASGGVNLNAGSFAGREGFLHYEPYNPQDKNTQSVVTWVDGEQYARGVKGEFKVPLKNTASSSIDTPVAIQATAGFDTNLGGNAGVSLGGSTNGAGVATTLGSTPSTGEIASILA